MDTGRYGENIMKQKKNVDCIIALEYDIYIEFTGIQTTWEWF